MSVAHLFEDPVASGSDQQPDKTKAIAINTAALRTRASCGSAYFLNDRIVSQECRVGNRNSLQVRQLRCRICAVLLWETREPSLSPTARMFSALAPYPFSAELRTGYLAVG
jgi:hypothetical protein